MKIQAVNNSNVKFTGLFTDKTADNGGNWRMEYQPYSWENYNTGKMTAKKQFNEFSYVLPDNEEIYRTGIDGYKEYSSDIYGTKSYYVKDNGVMRRDITQMPAMNREDSLKVYNSKLDKFLQIKKNKKAEVRSDLDNLFNSVKDESKKFNDYSRDYNECFFGKSTYKMYMEMAEDSEFDYSKKMYQKALDYISLANSTEDIKKLKERNLNELSQISQLKESGRLIDISKRDIKDADAPLIAALKNIEEAGKKFISLPHKLMSMPEIFEEAKRLKMYNPEGILEVVRMLIRTGK